MPGLIEGAAGGPRARSPVPAAHRAGAGARGAVRPRAGRRACARRTGTRPARRAAALPARAARPAARVVGSKADVATEDVATSGFEGLAISAVTRAGLDEFVGEVAATRRRGARRRRRARAVSWCCGRRSRAIRVVREGTNEWRVTGPAGRARGRARRHHRRPTRSRTSSRSCGAWASSARWHGRARVTATSCASARSSSPTKRHRERISGGREDRELVDHARRRASSTTPRW